MPDAEDWQAINCTTRDLPACHSSIHQLQHPFWLLGSQGVLCSTKLCAQPSPQNRHKMVEAYQQDKGPS